MFALTEQENSVWGEVERFLDTFISTDTYQPSKGIATVVGDGVVPEDTIVLVRDKVQDIRTVLSREIERTKKKPISASPKKKATGRKAPKRSKLNVKKKKQTKKKRKTSDRA